MLREIIKLNRHIQVASNIVLAFDSYLMQSRSVVKHSISNFHFQNIIDYWYKEEPWIFPKGF